MKHTVTFVALFALATPVFTTSAFAGSLAEPVVETTSVAPEVYVASLSLGGDWTGFYGGLQLGQHDVDGTGAADGDDISYGLHAGYDYDFDRFVLGGDLDYDFTDIDLGGAATVDNVLRLKCAVVTIWGEPLFTQLLVLHVWIPAWELTTVNFPV